MFRSTGSNCPPFSVLKNLKNTNWTPDQQLQQVDLLEQINRMPKGVCWLDDWSSEEFVVCSRVHVHDLHATILHLMGIDYQRLTYRHSGRDYRLKDVSGKVFRGILS